MIEKRELIIEAAFGVFSEKGYHAAKMEDISDAAGIGKGTLYSYFKNKQDLFDKMVFWFLDKYFLKLEEGISEEDKIQDVIKKFISNHIAVLIKTRAAFLTVMTDFSSIPRSKEEIILFHQNFIYTKIIRYSEIFSKAKVKGELRDVSPETAANFLLGALKGISESIIVMEKIDDADKIAEEVSDLLCYGIARRR